MLSQVRSRSRQTVMDAPSDERNVHDRIRIDVFAVTVVAQLQLIVANQRIIGESPRARWSTNPP